MTGRDVLVLYGSWGREEIVLRLKDKGYRIVAVVVPQVLSAKLAKSVKIITREIGPVVECRKSNLQSVLKRFSCDVLLSVGFPYLLKPSILRMFPICLNVPPTLLPKYRGPTTGAYILMNNEGFSGSTVHIMDEGMDTGPIVVQQKVKLTRFDTIRSLQSKVYALEPDLVEQALELIATPGFQPTVQDKNKATIYPQKRTPEDSEIDPGKPLLELFDRVRACDPEEFPAFFYVENQKVCIKFWRPEQPETDDNESL